MTKKAVNIGFDNELMYASPAAKQCEQVVVDISRSAPVIGHSSPAYIN